MAHIKVTRRSMRPEEYISLRYGWLKRVVHENLTQISPVMIRNTRQTGENKFDFYEDTPYELKKGELCYTPDGSIFFTAAANVPAAFAGREVYLYFKTTSEVIVKVNGHYAGGFDPNRQRINITPFIENGFAEIEMLGFNRSKPDDERNPETLALRGCRQVFEGLYFCTVNENVQALCYDLEIFTDIIGSDAFSGDYRAFVKKHVDAALDLIDFDDYKPEDVRRAAAYIEEHIYGDTTWRGSGRVALVAHSHLDIAYYWRRLHTVQKNLRTVLIQIRLMDKYPEFTYCHTQPYLYETLKEHYPEVFEELKQKVAEGRFEPVGAMYVEPDCNIPNAESLVRQCLYGQRFYMENFGFTVNTCWVPDVFGNSWILPQILKKSGVDYFVSNKMSTWNDTNRFPHNHFIWRGIDGTDIYACVPPTHFISWNAPSQIVENWDAFQEKETGAETLQMFGYGDGGSGATEEMIELARRFRKLSAMPQTRHIRADRFLEENFTPEKDLAVWDGELYLEMHRGTFTTKAALKKANRELEVKFRTAEILSVLRGGKYPAEKIRTLYKKFLLQQFHDILPGSHITPVFEDAMRDLAEVEKGLDEIIGTGDCLFNTLNFHRSGIAFLPREGGAFTRKGEKGDFVRIRAAALSAVETEAPRADTDWIAVNGFTVETDRYSIAFAPDGSIESFLWNGRQLAAGPFNKLRLYDDKPGNYDAWDILPDYAKKERPLTLLSPLTLTALSGECAEFTVVEGTEKSRIERKIRVFREALPGFLPGIEVEVIAHWHESHKLLKAEFTPNVLTRELTCDTSAGFIKRPMHKNTSWEAARFECCTHKWFYMGETDFGFAVINDGKYGVGIGEKSVTLSLLRATERPDPCSDLGRHDFCYLILPSAWTNDYHYVNRAALEYNAPLVCIAPIEINGTLQALLDAFSEYLHLQALKRSEDGKKTICRLIETDGRRGCIVLDRTVTVTDLLEHPLYETDVLEYKPFEIITVAF